MEWCQARDNSGQQITDVMADVTKQMEDVGDFKKKYDFSKETVNQRTLVRFENDIKELKNDLEVHFRKFEKRKPLFPSQWQTLISSFGDKAQKISTAFINFQTQFELERQENRNHEDKFIRGVHDAPINDRDLVLDFEPPAKAGSTLTFECQLLDAVLEPNDSSPVTIAVNGVSGVGKTCALKGIGNHERVKKRFWGAILFIKLGQDIGEQKLREKIAEKVKKTGGNETSKKILVAESFKEAIDIAGEWFEPHHCLFLFDDVWRENWVKPQTIDYLKKIARSDKTRVVITTQDFLLNADKEIQFNRRGTFSEVSEKILLASADFNTKPKSPAAVRAFEELLNYSGGLPLYLAICGRAVREQAKTWCKSKPEEAWETFVSREGVKQTICKEAEFKVMLRAIIHTHEKSNTEHYENFKSLCILRNTQQFPISAACRLWALPKVEGCEEAKLFARYQIVELSIDKDKGNTSHEWLRLHDNMLEIARSEANDDSFSDYAWQLLRSYLHFPDVPYAHGVSTRNIPDQRNKPLQAGNNSCLNSAGKESEFKTCLCFTKQPHHVPKFHIDSKGRIWAPLKCNSNLMCSPDVSRNLDPVNDGEWYVVEDDGFIYENFCWLLSKTNCYEQLMLLASQPQWLIHMMETYDVAQVLKDLELTLNCTSKFPENSQTIELQRNIKLIMSTIIASKTDIQSSNWKEMMIWFQLHGRMSQFVGQSEWIRAYVRSIEQHGPRPWYKPSVGCLLPPVSSMKDEIGLPDRPFRVAILKNNVFCCYKNRKDKNIFWSKYDLMSKSYEKEQIVISGTDNNIKTVSFENDSYIVVIGLNNDDIRLFKPTLPRQPEHSSNHPLPKPLTTSKTMSVVKLVKKRFFRQDQNKSKQPDIKQDIKDKLDIRCFNEYVGKHHKIQTLDVSRDGKRIISGSKDGTVYLWDQLSDGWEKTLLSSSSVEIRCVALSRSADRAVIGHINNTINVWNVQGDRKEQEAELKGPANDLFCMDISSEGAHIVSASMNGRVQIFSQKEGVWMSPPEEVHIPGACSLTVSTDGTQVVCGSSEITVWRRYFKDRRQVIERHKGHQGSASVHLVAFNEDESQIVCGSDDNKVQVWGLQKKEWEDTEFQHHSDRVSGVTVSEDGFRVVSWSNDCTLRVWDKSEGGWDSKALSGHLKAVTIGAMNTDGSCVVSGSRDNTIRVWSLQEGEWKSEELKCNAVPDHCMAVSADGTLIVAGSREEKAIVWKLHKERWQYTELDREHKCSVHSVALSDSSKRVVTGSDDCTIRVWDHQYRDHQNGEWKCEKPDEAHKDFVRNVWISRSGSHILSKSRGEMRLWEKQNTGWKSTTLNKEEHSAWIRKEKWNPSSSEVADAVLHGKLSEIMRAVKGKKIYRANETYFICIDQKPYLVWVEEISC